MNKETKKLIDRFKNNIGFEKLTKGNIYLLAVFVSEELKKHTRFELWVSNVKFVEKKGKIKEVYIRLLGDYFSTERSGVNFEQKNNIVGFGGWMDDESCKPLERGFEKWLNYIIDNKEVA